MGIYFAYTTCCIINLHELNELMEGRPNWELHKKIAMEEGIDRFTVGAVIMHDKKILLLKRRPDDFLGGMYEIPGGKVEAGETIHDAIVREVLEETGLKVLQIAGYLGHFDYISGSGRKTRQFNFLVNVLPGEVKLSEHENYAWASKTDLDNYKTSGEVRLILKKGF